MSANSRFYFKPGENERVETVVSLRPDARSAIHGLVRDPAGRPLPDVLVMLFEVSPDADPLLIGQMFTDEDGQFAFGPLVSGRLHLVKAYKNAVKLRQLELVTPADSDA